MDAEKVELKLLNTMTQVKEVLKPINPGKIGIYLKHLGYEVTYVRNFTDVDDKYLVDMGGLQCLLPTHQPRVSDHMEHIVKMIEKIIENECGYVVGGDVFFSVDKSPDYGRLSGQRLDHTQAGKRVAVDPRKRNPADFALWKAAKPGEPSWESPWGAGRPGWHIECSAMSAHYLSPRFDIHGGGIDLKFPHHENETAQTCAACEDSGVNYWLHNGHVTVNDEKMAKSLKNFKTIREITAEYHPLALRHFLMSAHYRSDMNFSISQLEISSDSLYYIYQTLQDFVEAKDALAEDKGNAQQTSEAEKVIKKVKSEFEANMSDDLNTTPILTGAFQDAMKFINVSITKVKIPKDMQSPEKEKKIQEMLLLVVSLLEVEKAVRDVLDVLGLLSSLSYAEFLEEMKQKALVKAKMSEEEIMQIIEERRVAKRNKKWTKSDEIRKTLAIKGISLMDIPKEDTVGWRPCIPPQSQTNSAEVNATPESESTPLA